MLVEVPLNPHQEEFVRQTVESKRFLSVEHLFLAAINLLEDRERIRAARLEEMHREIRKSQRRHSGHIMGAEQIMSAEHPAPTEA